MDDFDFSPNKAKSPAIPQFYTEAVQNNFKTQQEGRPIFEDRHFVRVIIPGDMRSQPVYEVTDEHKQRWPKEWAAFERGQAEVHTGTPITEWAAISRARATELKMREIHTLEQLAEVGDNILPNLGMGARELREKARKHLEIAKTGTGPIERLMDENARLRADAELKDRTIAEMGARIDALESSKEAKRARPAA